MATDPCPTCGRIHTGPCPVGDDPDEDDINTVPEPTPIHTPGTDDWHADGEHD